MTSFIGREKEIEDLRRLENSGKVSLVVIKGRRRIGKSRLVQEFAKDKKFLHFSGLAPIDSLNEQDQRDNFAKQLAEQIHLPQFLFKNWSDAFNSLSHYIQNKPTIILFDEISWMGDKDPTFVPKLKNWFDLDLKNRLNILLILCGSVSTWIEKNIINSTAFFGRISLTIDLLPLSISESSKFLKNEGFKGSSFEFFKVLSVIGGVPWYLEQISGELMADDNIRKLCFERNGILTFEYDRIFNDLFKGTGTVYKKVIHTLSEGMRTLAEVRDIINYPDSGSLSTIMKNLIISGFITKHYQWSIKTGKLSKQSLFRLSDCYIRFYIKYIEGELEKIQQDTYKDFQMSQLPNWESIMGYQVESLLLQNRVTLLKLIGINPATILMDNPYMQRKNTKQRGCQIDYLVQTHTKNLFICEFKFNRRELGVEIIEEVQEKIDRFSVPKGFGVVPVLFHLGGVTNKVYDKKYFYKIIDLNDMLD